VIGWGEGACLRSRQGAQTFNLIGRISVQKNVEVPMMLSGVVREAKERALKLLQTLALLIALISAPQNISGRERRGGHCQSFANDPTIIIADEPTGNLDLKNSKEVMKF